MHRVISSVFGFPRFLVRLWCAGCLWMALIGSVAAQQSPEVDRFEIGRKNEDKYLSIMRTLEAAIRANYERLSTWSGTYELQEGSLQGSFQSISGDPSGKSNAVLHNGSFWMQRSVVVHFSLDLRNDRLFSTFEAAEPIAIKDRQTDQLLEGRGTAFEQQNLITREHWISANFPFGSNSKQGGRGQGINTAVRSITDEAKRMMTYSTVVDPRRFYAVSHDLTFFKLLAMNIDWLTKHHELPIEIRETKKDSGIIYTLVQEYRFGEDRKERPRVIETVFDSAAGFNPVSITETSPEGQLESRREWEYLKASDIYLPSRFVLKKYLENSTDLQLERDFRLADSKVNEPIAESVFTWDQLGLIEGDQIRDDIRGETFRYGDGKLVPAGQYVESTPVVEKVAEFKRSEDPNRFNLIVIVNIGFIMLIVAAAVLARRRKR